MESSHKQQQAAAQKVVPQPTPQDDLAAPQVEPGELAHKVHADARRLSPAEVVQLQRVVGNHAVSQIVGGQTTAQRLMALEDFQESTSLTARFRRKIKAIDTEITAYQALKVDDYVGRSTQLAAIIRECNVYLGYENKDAKRKAGVQAFLPQAQKEKQIYDTMILYANAGGRKAKWDHLVIAQDQANAAEAAGCTVLEGGKGIYYHVNNEMGKLLLDIKQNQPAVIQQILQDEVAKLRAILADPTTPDITKNVLTEVLANMGDVNLAWGMPGAALTSPKQQAAGVNEKYTLNHSLDQLGGTAERAGSLTHELTHVSSGESFNNTALFLLFDPNTSAADIIKMAQDRKADVLALKALYADDAALSPRQKKLITDKMDYAMESKLGYYASKFFQANKIDAPTRDKLNEVAQAVSENNTLIEFDSVMNQCLIYMQQWGIPQNNAFYTKLMQVADAAYKARTAAHP